IIRLAKRDIAPDTESVSYLIHRFLHHAWLSHGQQINIFRTGLQFSGHVIRQVNDVVLIVAAATEKKLLPLLQRPNDPIFFRIDLQRLSYRTTEFEEIVGHLRSDDAHVLVRIVLELREE